MVHVPLFVMRLPAGAAEWQLASNEKTGAGRDSGCSVADGDEVIAGLPERGRILHVGRQRRGPMSIRNSPAPREALHPSHERGAHPEKIGKQEKTVSNGKVLRFHRRV